MIDASDMPIPKLHRLYCELSGRDEQLNMATEHDWVNWLTLLKHRPEWQPESMLRLVVSYRQWEIRSGRRHPASLAFRNMVRDIAQADDLIADALAARRNQQKARMPEGKQAVMRATGRSTEIPQSDAKKVDEILASQAFKEFVKLKDTL